MIYVLFIWRVIEACLHVAIAMLYFCHSKNPSIIMKNVFNSISTLKKNLIVSKYRKQMCYKKNESVFLTLWKMAKFFFQKFIISSMIAYSFLIEKWGRLDNARRYDCRNVLNLGCQDSICFGIFQVILKRRIILGELLHLIFCKMFW